MDETGAYNQVKPKALGRHQTDAALHHPGDVCVTGGHRSMRVPLTLRALHLIAITLVVTILSWAGTSNADGPIAGTYDVHGINPGGTRYTGIVEIVEDGQTYRVLWQVGSQTIRGVGVATPTSLAVAFGGGVVLYERASADTWCGIWTSGKGRQLGREMLTRQQHGNVEAPGNCNSIQAMLSTSSSDRWPGTIVTGTRSLPTNLLVSADTSGPGPRGPVAAPSTRMEIVGSSSISFSSSSRRAPSRT